MFTYIYILLLLISLTVQEPIPITIDESYRYSIIPHQFQCFSIKQQNLKPTASYDIKLSFLGTV